MKKGFVLHSIICLLTISCSVHEIETIAPILSEDNVFYATFESYSEPDTKVFLDENIKILWDADDRITIFNKNTFNQQYRFTGDTGDNSGFFKIVPSDDFATGNDMGFICAVYPYLEATSISNSGVLTLTLPAEQAYREESFGPGANTMISSTSDNLLRFKNVGGYLALKFYGDDVSVSSIKLEGNHNEPLSGDAALTPTMGADPLIAMASTAGTSITLTCETPVELGATKDDATIFWIVVPPTDFTEGFKLTVTAPDGRTYVKETDKDLSIARNGVLRISPIQVELSEPIQPDNVIYYTSSDGQIVTPYKSDVFGANIVSNEMINGQGVMTFDGDVTSIGEKAFYRCRELTSIEIPSTVTSIGDEAFWTCQNMSSPTIPISVMSIGTEALYDCRGLTSIFIPSSVTSIGSRAFNACQGLTSIVVSSENPIFDSRNNCNSIIRTSDNKLIAGCMNSVIPESVTTIEDYAFWACRNLYSILIPDSVTSIGQEAFGACSNLLSVTMGDHLTTIGSGAFYSCYNLKSISIPDSVTSIGSSAFGGCSALTSISFPDTITTISSSTFSSCINLQSFIIPEGVTSIGNYAFYNCSSLTSIAIPDNVTSIGTHAFSGCYRFTSFVFPASVSYIGSYILDGCNKLTSIKVFATSPPLLEDRYAFTGTSCSILVPAGSVNTYKKTGNWISYADRIQAIPE